MLLHSFRAAKNMSKITVGVSTASLFKRSYNEDSVHILNGEGIDVCEVFLGTYREYKPSFAELLKERKDKLSVHSVHTLNTHFEPQLFSANPRALEDAYFILDDVLASAKILGANYYTFHGVARIKKKIAYDNYAAIGKKFADLTEYCQKREVAVALENVEWAYYNHPGFFSGVKQYAPLLKGTLDIKQARDSGEGYMPFLKEMGSNVVTVHVSDINEDGRLCLPGAGVTDFEELIRALMEEGVTAPLLIEVYKENYSKIEELTRSYNYLKELVYKLT